VEILLKQNTFLLGLSMLNAQPKIEDSVPIEGGVIDYNVSASQIMSYPSNIPLYGHPGSGGTFIQMPNGTYLPYYTSPMGGSGAGPQGPPSTDILMNPGHIQHQYPYFPYGLPNFGSINPNSKPMCANNPTAKDSGKQQGVVTIVSDAAKVIGSQNDPSAFGRSGQPSNTQSSTSVNMNSAGVVPVPSPSPMSNQPGRRGVILEVGGQSPGIFS
jgi:hypothetical protein